MLRELSIRNIVLIEECELAFAPGLCVLTGETGAGKSILLDALGLVLGMRSDARLIRRGKDQASVSAVFDISGNASLPPLLEEFALEAEDELRLRRVLSADGRTRCFINDVAVGVATLRTVGDALLEINGQHDGRGLLDPGTHRALIDEYGALAPLVGKTNAAYTEWKKASDSLAAAKRQIEEIAREKDYLQHMQKELATLAPEPGEEQTLADARRIMMQSEKLTSTLHDAQNELAAGKGAAGMIATAQRILSRSALGAEGQFSAAIEALERAGEELATADSALEKLLAAGEYSPEKLEQMEERLFALRAAARKYNMTVDELSNLLIEVTTKLDQHKTQVHEISALEKAVGAAKEQYVKAAEKLTSGRIKAARALEKAVAGELAPLKMAATVFTVRVEPLSEERWSGAGADTVQFEAATNKGTALAPLHKIASGGELSRFMLAMKVALANVRSTATLIFDEIDTGTGGAVADAVGQRLAKLGKTHQVLVVTHLPQVAARGDHHLRVQKGEKAGATYTRVEALDAKERKEELARMLAGAEVTAEARKAAGKLLQAAG